MSQHRDTTGLGFATRAIHAGQAPDPSTGAIMPPISRPRLTCKAARVHQDWTTGARTTRRAGLRALRRRP